MCPAIAMADFAGRLLALAIEDENFEIFENFNNALLSAEILCSETGRLHRDIFLEKMYVGSFYIAESTAFLMASGFRSEGDQAELDNHHALVGFWTAQVRIISELSRTTGPNTHLRKSIDGISFNNRDLLFYLNYFCPHDAIDKRVAVTSVAVIDGQTIYRVRDNQYLSNLRLARDNFSRNLVENIVIGTGMVALSAINPKAAIFASLGAMVASGSADTVKGLESLANSNPRIKTMLSGGNEAFKQAVNGFMGWQRVNNAMSNADRERFTQWFGSGTYSNYLLDTPWAWRTEGANTQRVTSEGLFCPHSIRLAQDWERNGIAHHLGMDDDDVNDLIDDLVARSVTQPQTYTDELISDVRNLLTGGFTLVGGIDSERTFESERFGNAILKYK